MLLLFSMQKTGLVLRGETAGWEILSCVRSYDSTQKLPGFLLFDPKKYPPHPEI
jgi:hypothetical protein